MEKSVIQYGYCPLKGSEYFVSVKYKLFDINRYKKRNFECAYMTYYEKYCPYKKECPIERTAPETLE